MPKLFKRNCLKCGKRFKPVGKEHRVCFDCLPIHVISRLKNHGK